MKKRQELANRLQTAGCAIDLTGRADWQDAGDFSISRPSYPPSGTMAEGSPEMVKYVDLNYPSDSGLQAHLAEKGFILRWERDDRLARAIDIKGWHLVFIEEGGKNVVLKLRDRPMEQTLIMKSR